MRFISHQFSLTVALEWLGANSPRLVGIILTLQRKYWCMNEQGHVLRSYALRLPPTAVLLGGCSCRGLVDIAAVVEVPICPDQTIVKCAC
jgi:hypothetical protein